MAKKESKFDAVTVVGVIVAIALFVGGQMYMAKRHREMAEAQATLTSTSTSTATGTQTQAVSTTQTATGTAADSGKVASADPKETPEKKDPNPVQTNTGEKAPPAGDAEPAAVPDITVTNDNLKLVFSSKGATLTTASLESEYTNPADKSAGKGLEILTEIESGKHTFGVPNFDIGSTEAGKEKERLVYTGPSGVKKSLDSRVWKLVSSTGNFDAGDWKIVYSTSLNGQYTVTKTFIIPKTGSNLKMDLSVENASGQPVSFQYTLNGPQGVLLDGPKDDPKGGTGAFIKAELGGRDADETTPEVKGVYSDTAAKGGEDKTSISKPENLWAALKNRFYIGMLVSLQPKQVIRLTANPLKYDGTVTDDKRLTEPNIGLTAQRYIYSNLEDKKSATDSYALYLGPNDEERLQSAEDALKLSKPVYMREVVQYCDLFYMRWPRLDWVARKMMLLFQGLHVLFGSYGIAVVLLTLVIKLAMHPMQRKMTINMDKMSKLKPEIDKITAKYKNQTTTDARMKQQMEQSDLYKKHNINPTAGCLPMFFQIPIFSALYGIFNHAFEIRGAEFLWIKDLSRQDHLMSLPFYPGVLNLLPIIYMVVTIVSTTYFAPQMKSADPQQEQQQKFMKFMPVLFSFMFYRMAAGLVLYFAASAIFSIMETWYIRKYLITSSAGTPEAPAGSAVPAK